MTRVERCLGSEVLWLPSVVYGKRMAVVVGQTLSLVMVSVSSTIQAEHLKVAEPGAPEASLVVEARQCFHPTLRTIH
jgi:hypothetical protein